MNKEEKEKWIFNIHKEDIIEDTISYKSKLKKKYDLSVEEVHDLFIKIVNYQIDKYGIQKQKFVHFLKREDCIIRSIRSAKRRYERTKSR